MARYPEVDLAHRVIVVKYLSKGLLGYTGQIFRGLSIASRFPLAGVDRKVCYGKKTINERYTEWEKEHRSPEHHC